MSLGYAYAGACTLLTRTQCYLTREQWEKTSLRGAYALGNLEKMMPHHRFCLRHCLFSPSNMFAASALWGWRRARGRRRGRRATRQRGNVLRKFQKQFQRRGFFGAIAGPKRLLFARACGMWATTQKVKFSLRAAYAELTRNVAIVLGNYNQKNRTIKKTHKETIVEGQSLTLICTCHKCAYAQCLRRTFLTKTLTPPCANQGFAYARCSYDKALIKTIQNGFWGRSVAAAVVGVVVA